MNTVATYTLLQVFQYDPTRTLTLRNAWVRAMNERFNKLSAAIRKAVVEEDVFGLSPNTFSPALSTPGHNAFAFPRTADKVQAFMEWLAEQERKGILEMMNFNRVGS